ncbi:CHAP domain-containing protein [Streptococcus castoreus]|uniref:CHAP domain-containing protein n=1 Tax=Streptococcus castoreus TaxID=254786 RepID=UPI0004178576|nr:CHAP domain-containing protein [Streptococcus castoreus]
MKKKKLLAVTLLSTLLLNSMAPLVVADTIQETSSSPTDKKTVSKSQQAKGSSKLIKEKKTMIDGQTQSQNDEKSLTDQESEVSSKESNSKDKKSNSTEKQPNDTADTDNEKGEKEKQEQQESQPKVDNPKVQDAPSPTVPSKTSAVQQPINQVPILPMSSLPPVFDEKNEKSRSSSRSSAAYVQHWTGDSAYSHNLLSRRYGITAEQLDGFLDSLGIPYDKERLNGKRLLEWEKASGLDVRAIVAIAMAESSLGTQGVAKEKGANMFGYGAFDTNPTNAKRYNDDKAIRYLVEETIIQNKNQTFERQDLKAQKLALGQLDTLREGGVYFTDTSGSGQRRADIMTRLDQWIDAHGGTPEIPEHLKVVSSSQFSEIPLGYRTSAPLNVLNYRTTTYSFGQCTWYAYNRVQELGYKVDEYMGNGGDWQNKSGFVTTHKPKVGYVVSFSPGQAGADLTYGHVGVVEQVKEDGSILISESNVMGLGIISYRTFSADQAKLLSYVVGEKIKNHK